MIKPRQPLKVWIELGVLFSPAIPALIWVWHRLESGSLAHTLFQVISYIYLFCGATWIGRRRWSWDELGVNAHGLWLSLACGAALIAGMVVLVRFAMVPPFQWMPPRVIALLGELVFYILFVGVTEELLYRGLIYRILLDWKGAWTAVIGSAVGFALFHIGWANLLQMVYMTFIGIIFALIRLRAGGILGLIFVHGFYDILGIEFYRNIDKEAVSIASVAHREFVIVGEVVILGLFVYLTVIHPRLSRSKTKSSSIEPVHLPMEREEK